MSLNDPAQCRAVPSVRFSVVAMENVRVLTIMELLQGSSPITATSSPHCKPSSLSTNSSHSKQTPFPSTSTDPNPDSPKVLTPLDHPAIIIGTLILPTASDTSNPTLPCSYNSCFQFTDGSAAICCDILDLDVRIIGKKIRVLAWNFIPIKHGGGFLEIIRWSFPDSYSGPSRCLKVDSFSLTSGSSPFCEDSSKAPYRIHGALESISPISVVPCTSSVSDSKSTRGCNLIPSTNLRGFLVQILVCECKFCTSKQSRLLQDSIQEHHSHSFTKPLFVYFCGSASSWHPVFTKLIGNLVNISGLKKKLIYIANEESRLMYVTTEKSNLHLPSFLKKRVQNNKTSINGKGEFGTYVGIIRGVYMQGMVVEMDNEVWLLLTDQLLTPPHSLRVGAIISVTNVHFVDPKFSWTKMLILGACFKTSISVKCFSPLVTGCHMLSQSQSMLGNFIGSLAFSARLWVLLLVSCFRQKFAGILSGKEILGSKNKEGLVQMYASSHLPSSTLRPRLGMFMALCKHDTCGCGCQQYSGNLKLAVPIFSSICHSKSTWIRELQLRNENKILRDSNQYNLLSCEGRSYGQSIRKIFSSEDIGIILIGNLKISPSSGRLQLVDATGSIDVFIPDLPSTWNSNSIYEVIDYSLVIEGMPGQVEHFRWIQNELFSCRSIFNFTPLVREINLTVYVYFRLGTATCRNFPFYPCKESKEAFQRPESGIFHLLYVTHKFPVLQKGDAVISDTSSVFVEALIFSWNLFLPGKDEIVHQTKNSVDQLTDCMQHCDGSNASLKRYKVDHESGWALSGLVDIPCKVFREFSGCSNSYAKSNEKQRQCNLTSHEISCLAAIRGVNNHGGVHSVNLSCTRAMLSSWGFCRPSSCKVMLEFKPESYHKYQLLRIGCYYITSHDSKDSFCNLKNFGNASGVKVLVTSTTHLSSLSFFPDGVLQSSNSSKHPPLDGLSCIHGEFPCKNHNEEVLLQMLNDNSLETCSDVSLFLPANIISFFGPNRSKMDESLVQPAMTPEGTAEASPCSGAVVPSPLLLSKSNCLLPEGNLISLRGIIVAAHEVDHDSVFAHLSCQNLRFPLQSKFVHGFASSSCFHVLIDNEIVKISGAISKHAFPIGFGAGVDATFHRVLELRGQNRWMLTPVSFTVINSIRVVNDICSDKCSNLDSCMYDASLNTITSGLIFQLVQCFDCKPMQSHCRVVAVSFLVLEKKKRTDVCLQSKLCSRQDPIDVPLACFVMDDGSSLCCCWANAESAAALLRLHEMLPQRTFESNDWRLKGFETDNSVRSPIIFQLERILKNHDRITVKNYGSFFDSSYQDLAVSVSSENALSSSDESFLKLVVYNACFGTLWTIAASLMDSDTVRQLMKDNLLETEASMHSMQHIWAKEVHHTNPCTEARNVIQELLDSGPND